MNVELLVDAVVRQTTVLLAHLATAAGARTPLAHTANQMFLDVARELRAQGMTHAVIADMFGMALRTYHKKVQRLSESATFRGQSLWTAVFKHVSEHGPLLRKEVLHRFRNDDEATLRGVLSDMVEAGALYASGSGDTTAYRAVTADEVPAAWKQSPDSILPIIWVAVYRYGPVTLEELSNVVPTSSDALNVALRTLLDDGRISAAGDGAELRYSCEYCYIPLGAEQGWEAAVFDHYQAVVTAICRKLRSKSQQLADVSTGGSTYRFTVWSGHPEHAAVSNLLTRLRAEASTLRERVERYNQTHDAPSDDDYEHFVAYVGQTRLSDDPDTNP